MKKILKKSLIIILSITIVLSFSLIVFAASSSTTVYITNSGSKYHSSGCQYLSKSKIAISLGDAINKGYTACSKCNPPTLTYSGTTSGNSSNSSSYSGISSSSQSTTQSYNSSSKSTSSQSTTQNSSSSTKTTSNNLSNSKEEKISDAAPLYIMGVVALGGFVAYKYIDRKNKKVSPEIRANILSDLRNTTDGIGSGETCWCCGKEISQDSIFCKYCGAKVRK